jgi:uncharacterized LabA/DUF88 family protein
VPVGWEGYLDRLGPQGLRVVVSGLLTSRDVVELTGAPAASTDSNETVLQIVDAVAETPEVGARLLDVLDERGGGDDGAISDEGVAREEIARILREPSEDAAAVLHRLARPSRSALPAAELRTAADIVASAVFHEEPGTRPKWVAKIASDSGRVKEIEEERRELEQRVRQLEGQLTRALERSATLEERLSKRLQEVATLRRAERLEREERQRGEREVERLRRRIEVLNERRAKERTGEITTALRRLTTEQRRFASSMDELRKRERERRDALKMHTRRLEALEKVLERLVDLRDADTRSTAAAQEEILRELASLRREVEAGASDETATAPARRRRRDETPQRAALFVDVQNMFYGARDRGGRLDFEALLAAASDRRELVRAVAYLVEAKEIDQSAFIHLLQMKAYEVKRKPLRVRNDRTAKGNWDLEMALDALTTADNVDVVVLATGDGDFVPLVRELKLKGLRVEVYGFSRSTAPDLREAADRFYPITRRLLRPVKARKTTAKGAS